MENEKRHPVHPGEVLLEEFLKPMKLSQNALAKAIHVSPRRINEICLNKRGVTGDTALRLGRYFGTTADLWIGIQKTFEIDIAMDKISENLSEITPREEAA